MFAVTIDAKIPIRALKMARKRVQTTLPQIGRENSLIAVAEIRKRCPYRTGTLRNSIRPQFVSSTEHSYTDEVGSHIHYAAYVEFGTRHMSPRPYLHPGLIAAKPLMNAHTAMRIRGILRKRF